MKRLALIIFTGAVVLALAFLVANTFAEASGPVTDGMHVKPDLSVPADFPASPTAVTLYLPWKGGQTWNTTNGYCGDGHSCDSANQYALDFTPGATGDIVAVADGTVCVVQESIPDSATFGGPHAGNVVVIAHEGNCVERQNGTYSFYAHLRQNSVPVSIGQTVSRGTVIGHYGDSGYAFGAHLHFSINSQYWTYSQYGYSTGSGITKSATFADADVQRTGGVPKKGQPYRSDNYQGFQCNDVLPVGEGSSRKQLFIDAYNRMGGRTNLGCTRGGAYWWTDPASGRAVVRQDFTGSQGTNNFIITHNEMDDSPLGSVPAYATIGGINNRYMALGGIGNGTIGIPTSDEFVNMSGHPQSNFAGGYITWDGDSYEFYRWSAADTQTWHVKFFNGNNYDYNREATLIVRVTTPALAFNWGQGAPIYGRDGVWADYFSMVAARSIPFDAGRYNFHIQADDGVKLWIDNNLVINEWHPADGDHYNAEVNLTQGSHYVVLAHYEEAGAALVSLDWTKINPPGVPTLASPANNALFNRNDAITLSWNAAANADRYYAEVWGGPSVGNNSGWITGRSWAIGQLPGGSYQWRARARNAAGTEGGWSETRSFTVKLGSPANLPAAASGTQVDLAWGASADAAIIDGYRIYRNGAYFASVAATATTYRDTGLTCDTAYSYTVRAWRGAVESDASNAASAATGPCAGAPLFISAAGSGSVGGVPFTPADILRYDPAANRWIKAYDGSDHGTKTIGAFSVQDDGSLLLVFGVNQVITGLGTATPFDVVRFIPAAPNVYPLGSGRYDWYFRGKDHGLSTLSEKIDAVDMVGSWLSLSTVGVAKLPLAGGGTLTAADEDVFVYELNNARWRTTLILDGSLIPGMAVEDVCGVWDDPTSSDLYVTITGAFRVGGLSGNGKSIVRLTLNGGAYTPSAVQWLAPGATFPSNLSGIELER